MLGSDAKICSRIETFSNLDEDYWSFKGRAKRAHCHGLIKYPAMMVPQMQGELIDILAGADLNISTVYDPFVGSGTTLGESIARGLNFHGADINPLAVLACKAKADLTDVSLLDEAINKLSFELTSDNSENIDIHFKGINKWFLPRVQSSLSKIRRGIVKENNINIRRFLWVCFSDTIRKVCNSRSSTYKLHIKSQKDIEQIGNPLEIFFHTCDRNIRLKREQISSLPDRSKSASINLHVGNALDKPNTYEKSTCDLLVTSPPYGDNATTVTYGQFSYLTLSWTVMSDIADNIDESLLQFASSIDTASLGGSLKLDPVTLERPLDHSETFVKVYEKLKRVSGNGDRRLAAFIKDLDSSLDNIIYRMRKNGYMIWTLGNRRISGVSIPLDKILSELLQARGCHNVCEIERRIPTKSMASKNRSGSTMNHENTIILRV